MSKKDNVFYVEEKGMIVNSIDLGNVDTMDVIKRGKKQGIAITKRGKEGITELMGDVAKAFQIKYTTWVTGEKRKVSYNSLENASISLVIKKAKNYIEVYIEDAKSDYQENLITFLENYSEGYTHELVFDSGNKHGILGNIVDIKTKKSSSFGGQEVITSVSDHTGMTLVNTDMDIINTKTQDEIANMVKLRITSVIMIIKHNITLLEATTKEAVKVPLSGILG